MPATTRSRTARRRSDTPARTTALQCLRALIGELHRSARRIETRTGITNAQLLVLQFLARNGELSIGELATMTRTRQSAVSTVVARLARHGLVCRLPSPRDRRRTCLTLTPRARLLVKRAPQSPTARLITALDRLPEARVRALAAGLTALAGALGLDLAAPALLFEEATPPSRNGRRPRPA